MNTAARIANEPDEQDEICQLMDELGPAEGLVTEPQYYKDGDYVTLFFSEELCFAERIDELLTVYRSNETREMVGCKIKGISALVSHLDLTIGIEDDNVRVTWVFAAAGLVSNQKEIYYDLASKAKTLKMELIDVKEVPRLRAA